MKKIQNKIILFLLGASTGFVITLTVLKFTSKPSDMVAVFNQRRGELMNFWDPYGHAEVDKANAVSMEETSAFESHRHVKELGKSGVFAKNNLLKKMLLKKGKPRRLGKTLGRNNSFTFIENNFMFL